MQEIGTVFTLLGHERLKKLMHVFIFTHQLFGIGDIQPLTTAIAASASNGCPFARTTLFICVFVNSAWTLWVRFPLALRTLVYGV